MDRKGLLAASALIFRLSKKGRAPFHPSAEANGRREAPAQKSSKKEGRCLAARKDSLLYYRHQPKSKAVACRSKLLCMPGQRKKEREGLALVGSEEGRAKKKESRARVHVPEFTVVPRH